MTKYDSQVLRGVINSGHSALEAVADMADSMAAKNPDGYGPHFDGVRVTLNLFRREARISFTVR